MKLMLSLKEYEYIAQKILSKKGYKVDQDLLGEVVTAVAMADHKFDPSKGGLRNFRSLYAKYYLGNINKAKRRKRKEISIDASLSDNKRFSKIIESRKDYSSEEFLSFIKSLRMINDLQKRVIIYRFWHQCSLREISESENISVTKAQYTLTKALNRIKYVLQKEGY
jgi:RNA polymerase sigma factor (sigma-70 family)